MAIRRWEPFASLPRLREEMDRLFEDFFVDWPLLRRREEGRRLPSVDLAETDAELVLRAELPGVDKKGLEVEVLPDAVTIRAKTSEEKEIKEATYYRRERSWGAFERSIPLPVEVKSDQAKASLKDGLLEITLPKTEAARAKQPRKVEIT